MLILRAYANDRK